MTRGGGPGVAGLWQSAWPGVQRGAHVEQVARGWLRAVPLGLFPRVGDSFVPPLKAVAELRGVVGRLRGLTWGGAGWRSCCHCHRHCHLAALQPPSAGRVCPPFPAGLLGDGTVAVDVELAVWQCQPCCARARSLAAAPLPGLPSCLSSLVTNPSFDPRSQDPTNPERKRTRSGHSGISPSKWEPRGRGAPELAGTHCQLFPPPSGSSQHLQGPLAVEFSPWSLSLPCWRWH